MRLRIMSASRLTWAVMPRETQMASPVGRFKDHSASPPSTAIGDDDTLQPVSQPMLHRFERMCHIASYVPGSLSLRLSFSRPNSRPVLSLIHISEPTRLGMISYAV